MKRIAAALAVLALLGLGAASATASAADTPKYRLTLRAYSSEKSHLEDGNYPEDCANWTVANSTVAFETVAGRTFNLALIRHPLTDTIWGQVSSDLQPTTELIRYWRFRSHLAPSTEACSPCGPSSEYGQCTGDVFDDKGFDDCGGFAPTRRGFLMMFVSDRGITVSASPEADFSDCPEPRQDGLPLGSTTPRLDRVLIPNGTRQLLRMKPGTTRIIERKLRRGRCGTMRGRGLRVCVQTQVRIRVTRVS
ncbi:hypothetical protein [Conexibacter sp. CPCC 206217]|uniref:hypothetical protein n=1 Tax=Conexibacter sp. CPCC 206217 TaxID=3064574 RepID=UPI0027284C76|nr:hypothetical protein [Conexibacter sp. CPCC 206217]MDO8209060.1 hypothetical protein [Conexibacter sp. CPCC 206217]